MPINVGKNAGIIYSDNDDVISFFNSEITRVFSTKFEETFDLLSSICLSS